MSRGDLIDFASVMEVHVQVTGGKFVQLFNLQEVQIQTNPGLTPVDTVGGEDGKVGLAGFALGPVHNMLTFKSALPISTADYDLTWDEVCQGQKNLKIIGYVRGDTNGKRRQYKGRITSAQAAFGIGKTASNDVVIHCGRAKYVN